MRREVVDEMGGLNEEIEYHADDKEFFNLAHRAGWRLGWVPEQVVDHTVRPFLWPHLRYKLRGRMATGLNGLLLGEIYLRHPSLWAGYCGIAMVTMLALFAPLLLLAAAGLFALAVWAWAFRTYRSDPLVLLLLPAAGGAGLAAQLLGLHAGSVRLVVSLLFRWRSLRIIRKGWLARRGAADERGRIRRRKREQQARGDAPHTP